MNDSVTVVIPHYRSETLQSCLTSVFAHSDKNVTVIVVDDGPDAPSVQQARAAFPQVNVLRNDRNLGFSASCNRGLKAADTRFAVLLNDDTRVTAGWLSPMVDAAEADPSIAVCQPKLLSATKADTFDDGGAAGGYMDQLGYPFCRGRLLFHQEQDEGQYDATVPLFWACGSAMFIRLEALARVGYLDLDYYMHMEEIDLCWRLRDAGYRIMAVPLSTVFHYSAWSLPPEGFRRVYLKHRNNLAMICINMDLRSLLWVFPVRIPLEAMAALGYLAKREWKHVVAPLTAVLWILTHPFNLWSRRRRNRASTAPTSRRNRDGLFRGSILFQYYFKGVRAASALMSERPEA